jgi:predicted cupin superfamily sugar epimerase
VREASTLIFFFLLFLESKTAFAAHAYHARVSHIHANTSITLACQNKSTPTPINVHT